MGMKSESVSVSGPVVATGVRAGTLSAGVITVIGGTGGAGGTPGGATNATAARSIARTPAERPLPVPVQDVRAEPPAPPPTPFAGSSGLTLAAAGGTITRRTADELTVELPQPVERQLQRAPARALARAEDTAPPEVATTHADDHSGTHASSNGSGPAPAGGAAAAGPDLDEITEHVIEEIKRLALFERERSGDLFGDLPT